MPSYPNVHAISTTNGQVIGAPIVSVEECSPADDAGFTPGCIITAVDGHPLTDILEWQWLTSGDEIVVDYLDTEGDEGSVELWREPEQTWGFAFKGAVYDGVRQCRNACTFCFMRQLPQGLRPSLSLRDDDYRLSFLDGTFVTLTNMTDEDMDRIVTQRISPLRLSLHAVDADIRRAMIGRHAEHGMRCLEHLLDAGIEFCAQVVLVPGVNDGAVLEETLAWCLERPGILEVGIVPLGFTAHQDTFSRSFTEPAAAQEVLALVEGFQQRAVEQRGFPWVYAADEFYLNAYGASALEAIPGAAFYGDFAMYEDGIGIVRAFCTDFATCLDNGAVEACARALEAACCDAVMILGEAPRPYAAQLLAASPLSGKLQIRHVANRFFGGNVTVTGLLCGGDVADEVARIRQECTRACLVFLPHIMFNDDGLTLDGLRVEDIEARGGMPVVVVSCTPSEFLPQITAAAQHNSASVAIA